MWLMPLGWGFELRSLKPCLKASTVSLSTNAFGRQFHWDMAHGKNEYFIDLYYCSLCEMSVMFVLFLVSGSISMSLLGLGLLVCLC